MGNFELSIDHSLLAAAKIGFDVCLKQMIERAIETGSLEGTVTLKVGFDIHQMTEEETGEVYREPEISFKANYAVPLKQGVDGKVIERSRIVEKRDGGWMLVNNQVSMDELLEEDKHDTERAD